MSDLRTLELAHPLNPKQAEAYRATEIRDYRVHEMITLPLQEAYSLIGAGYAKGVEPSNPAQVAAALQVSEAEAAVTSTAAPSTPVPLAATEGAAAPDPEPTGGRSNFKKATGAADKT